jgi:hypothetical protein
MGETKMTELEFVCDNEELYANALANVCKMESLEYLYFEDYWDLHGVRYNAPYELLARSFATSKLTRMQLYPMSAINVKVLAKGLPSS